MTFGEWWEKYKNKAPRVSYRGCAEDAWNAALANQWQSIESAPKDGTEILVVFRGRVRIAHWDPVFGSDGWFVGNLRTLLSDRLECWMPLPAPPKGER